MARPKVSLRKRCRKLRRRSVPVVQHKTSENIPPAEDNEDKEDNEGSISMEPNDCASHDKSVANDGESIESGSQNITSFGVSNACHSAISSNFHDYFCCPSQGGTQAALAIPETEEETVVSPLLLTEAKDKLTLFLNHKWTALIHKDCITVVRLSQQDTLSIQRSLIFMPNGLVKLQVHCKPVCINPYLTNIDVPIPLDEKSINYCVDRMASIINVVDTMEICSGYDDPKFQEVWSVCPFGDIDRNPYQECRYIETFRAKSCSLLISGRRWRCFDCSKLYAPLRRRLKSVSENPHVNTANHYLTEAQKLKKLQDQRKELDNTKKKLLCLQIKMQQLIQKEGVVIDAPVSNDLSYILNSSNLTPAQSIFLQQQVKASQKTNMVGMRWHPTMIRFALALHITSPAAYELVKNTGMVKLPSSRTLFDYSKVKPIEEGIDKVVLESLGDRIGKLKHKYQKYHVLMADEMHICQNLIFQKSTGRMVGYTSMDDFDREICMLNEILDNPNPEEELEPKIASKVLTFMVKGVSSGFKEVVATYAVSNPSVEQMYIWTWSVIGALERTGIAVIAFICDGFSCNRAFIKKHKPVTKLPSGVVFDTNNKAAPDRTLYFISDVPHLIKTIRNCLLNSRSDKKPSRRKMIKNGKKISWDHIIRLYELKKKKMLRKSFKLNPMNVYPDSYARMKVKYAAEVLSRTVAQDLRDQGWDDASELIFFIEFVNDWFDCLNGAHSSVGRRKRNPRLDPYTSQDDKRFDFIESFLNYLDEWKNEANNVNTTVLDITINAAFNLSTGAPEESMTAVEEGRSPDEEETPASRRVLSHQTLEGIEMTSRAFKPMVQFLLTEETKFINARVFSQDPLEQHFSKVRAGQGGSTNPNFFQTLNRNRAIHIIGQLGMKRRRGNTTEDGTPAVEVTIEPLPKRQATDRLRWSHTA